MFVVWNEAKSTSQKSGKDIKELFHIPAGVLFEKKKAGEETVDGNDLTGDNVGSQDATLKKMKVNFHLKDCGTWRNFRLLLYAPSVTGGDVVLLTTPQNCR